MAQDHRAEDFLAHNLHVGLGVDHHGRLDEIALRPFALAARHGFRAFAQARFQIAAHAIQLLF